MTSVNRMNAQIKLTEVWKAINTDKCPLNVKVPLMVPEQREARSSAKGQLKITGASEGMKKTFINDSKKIWNNAPNDIKSCGSIYAAKATIKKFVKTLPL